MPNYAMQRKLSEKEAIDLSKWLTDAGTYSFPEYVFVEGKDYCDAKREVWIWYVWAPKNGAGNYIASAEFGAKNPDGFHCVWCR